MNNIHHIDNKKGSFVRFETHRDRIYYCPKLVFQSPKEEGRWIKDSNRLISFRFSCPHCEFSTIELSRMEHSRGQSYRLSQIHSPHRIRQGLYPWAIQCTNCQEAYHVEMGYIEPNNGRDVFTISRILSIKELQNTRYLTKISLPRPHAKDERIFLEYLLLTKKVTFQGTDFKLSFVFETLKGLPYEDKHPQLEFFFQDEKDEPPCGKLETAIMSGISQRVRELEKGNDKISDSTALKFSKVCYLPSKKYDSYSQEGVSSDDILEIQEFAYQFFNIIISTHKDYNPCLAWEDPLIDYQKDNIQIQNFKN